MEIRITDNKDPVLFDTIIWSDIWKSELNLNRQCQKKNNLSNFWVSKEQAYRFWQKTQEQISFYVPIFSSLDIKKGDSILDIGGGPGTIAIPLAKKGAHVTVIEPAIGMVSVLSDNVNAHAIQNLTIVNSQWEDVLPEQLGGPFDHIIACFSLGMPDIRTSIEKMVAVSSGKIYLIWFSGLNSWDMMMNGICTGACGLQYHESPKSNLLFLVLNQMGIYPEVTHVNQAFCEKFDSFDSAVNEIQQRCSHTYPGKKECIIKWVQENLTFHDGSYLWNPNVTISIMSWNMKNDTTFHKVG